MGVNWNAGNVRWTPYTDPQGKSFPLNHLHPFRFDYCIPATDSNKELSASIQVGFSMHCFTRGRVEGDDPALLYRDDREVRTFDHNRYELSKKLKELVQALDQRTCLHAKQDNYMVIDLENTQKVTVRYGVFFNLKKVGRSNGRPELLLVVQSTYELTPGKSLPKSEKIGFKVLVRHVINGTTPKRK